VHLARTNSIAELVDHAGSSDERDIGAARTQTSSDPTADRARAEYDDAAHALTVPGGTSDAISCVMTNARIPRKTQGGAIGYALAWILGFPIPILLIIFLVRGCD
jgi:hypothetical protein